MDRTICCEATKIILEAIDAGWEHPASIWVPEATPGRDADGHASVKSVADLAHSQDGEEHWEDAQRFLDSLAR